MMTGVRDLVLLLGLLLVARCDVRARDPELEEEEPGEVSERGGWEHGVPPGGFGTPHHGTGPHGQRPDIPGVAHLPLGHGPPQPGNMHPSMGLPEEAAPSGETGTHNFPARTGNWCAFVDRRVVSMAVSCGTEKYTIKSQSPCPSGTPDCQLVMYKLSTRPVYREKQNVFTVLLWRCCPGHGGHNCEETVADGHVSHPEDPTVAGRPHPGGAADHHTGAQRLTHLAGEQNDFQVSGSPLYESRSPGLENDTTTESNYDYGQAINQDHNHHRRDHVYDRTGDQDYDRTGDQDYDRTGPVEVDVEAPPLPFPDASGLLPHMATLLMAQLQPVLDGFNRTLERLSLEVQGLHRDMAQLQHGRAEEEHLEALGDGGGRGEQELLAFKAKLESFQQVEEVRELLSGQRYEMEERLHAQQAMLHYNLTAFKTDVDIKLKRSQKMLQVNLNSLNASLLELKQGQECLEKLQRGCQGQPQNGSGVWEAITRLDNKVVNNTVQLGGLAEDQELASGNIRDLQGGFIELEERIVQTGRNSQILFMETGLEVEAATVLVMKRMEQLAANLSQQARDLQETEVDVDYLFTQQNYRNISTSGDCDCGGFAAAISRLEKAMVNVTELAQDNWLALDGQADLGQDHWGDGGWGPSVENLKLDLLHVQNSLAFEQEKSRALQVNVSALQASLLGSQQAVGALQEADKTKAMEMRHLGSSFNSLLKDAIRHTEVLEILLGDEVLEFMDWSLQEQNAHSIPALKENIQQMQEQIEGHSLSLTSLLNTAPSEDTAADEPSVLVDWASRGLKKRSGNQRVKDPLGHVPEGYSDSDFWSLEKAVDELGQQVSRLEGQRCITCCNCTKNAAPAGMEVKLQTEVATLRRGLEDHLRLFKSIFSNTGGLAGSEATLDLDKLSAVMKRKEVKQKKRQKRKENVRGSQPADRAKLRSKKDASLETAELSDSPLMFLASTRDGVNTTGTVTFPSVSLNRGEMYSPETGTFRAPAAGVYLFVLTLDFGPGPSLAHLRRGGEGSVAATLHQGGRKPAGPATRVCLLQLEQGERLHLELSEGSLTHGRPHDNTFAGLLLYHTT